MNFNLNEAALAHSYGGFSLSPFEQLSFKNAALKAHIDEKLSHCPLLWGKIQGCERDYLIAVHVQTSFGQIRKQFYVYNPALASLDKLSPATVQTKRLASRLREPFSGDPTKQYQAAGELIKGQEHAEEDVALSELDRLSAVVSLIDFECAIVPRGALYLTAAKSIATNENYQGLSAATGTKLDSYQHFRDSLHDGVRERLANTLYHFTGDFLDSIAHDQPKGVWSVHVNDTSTAVQVRSNLWPGYVFDHQIDGTDMFSAYIGTGIRHDDIAFMV